MIVNQFDGSPNSVGDRSKSVGATMGDLKAKSSESMGDQGKKMKEVYREVMTSM